MTFTPDFKSAHVVPSPNHDARTTPIDILLLHYTGMKSGEGALERLTDTSSKVSSHYLVHEDGRIDQLGQRNALYGAILANPGLH